MKHWTSAELKIIRRLREGFLGGTAGERDYWRNEEELELYDGSLGERIGWKWDAVLSELSLRGWVPESRNIVDWGCGSGIAGRRVLAAWPGQFQRLSLYDRSPLAVQVAAKKAREQFSGIEVGSLNLKAPLPRDTLLVLSHVVNELPPEILDRLLRLASGAREIIWVESGTHADSRKLTTEVRERLREHFVTVAPCTHSNTCGMRAPENAHHWCHHFARVPSWAFQDARWAEFGVELGIDLRVLPYSFIVMQRPRAMPPTPDGYSRVIGEPREFKGHFKVLSSQAEGVTEFMLQKRDAPAVFRELKNRKNLPLYRWTLNESKIIGGERLVNELTADEDGGMSDR